MTEKRRRRNPVASNNVSNDQNVDNTQNHAITLDVEEEVLVEKDIKTLKEVIQEDKNINEEPKEDIQVELDVKNDNSEEEVVLIDTKKVAKEVAKETAKEVEPIKETKKTKRSKKTKEAEPIKETRSNLKTGTHDIAIMEEYLKEDLCPTTENLEKLRQEIIDKINSFYLEDNMTPEENIKLSHQVTNYIIELENIISVYNKKARFLKGMVEDETKKHGKGSNAEERKLNAFLRLTNYTKEPEDKPINLLIYLRVAEDMCEFLNLRLNALYRISDNLKSDKYFFEKLEREMKK